MYHLWWQESLMTKMSFYHSQLVSSKELLLLSPNLTATRGCFFFFKVPLLLFLVDFSGVLEWNRFCIQSSIFIPLCMYSKAIFSFSISTKSHEISWVQKYLSCTKEVMTTRHKVMWSEKGRLKFKLFDIHFFVNYNVLGLKYGLSRPQDSCSFTLYQYLKYFWH